jgi:hypothetical protein
MKTLKLVPMALVALFALNSCSNDDNAQPVNEEEVITNVSVTLSPQNLFGVPVILTSIDIDGSGPSAPVITTTGTITPGETYTGTVYLFNIFTTPPDDIAAEVLAEGDEHQFFFNAPGVGTFAYTDQDVNGRPIGLEFTFTASANAQSGNLTVILKHEPNKTAEGVAAGNIANAGGETDLQVSFPVIVE